MTNRGHIIQLPAIVMNFEKSTFDPTASPMPTIPPTIAWEVDTGIEKRVAVVTIRFL